MNKEASVSTGLPASFTKSSGDTEFQCTNDFSAVDTNYYSDNNRVPVKRSTSKGTHIIELRNIV